MKRTSEDKLAQLLILREMRRNSKKPWPEIRGLKHEGEKKCKTNTKSNVQQQWSFASSLTTLRGVQESVTKVLKRFGSLLSILWTSWNVKALVAVREVVSDLLKFFACVFIILGSLTAIFALMYLMHAFLHGRL